MEKEETKRCKICGARLIKKYKATGRCCHHQFKKGEDATLTDDAVEAKKRGMSYGEYMARKKEGQL